jgi:tetratricopeptide (TPR) repeat protein
MTDGMGAHRQGRLDHALRCYHNVLQQQPRHFMAAYLSGVLQLQLGKTADALRLLAIAVAVNPSDVDAAVDYGAALAMSGDPQRALVSFDRALAINPRHVGAYINRANVLGASGRIAEAIGALDAAHAIDPSNSLILNNRGSFLSQLGRFDDALASYSEALARAPRDVAAMRNRGNTLILLCRDAEALVQYEEALRRSPDDVEAHYGAAFARLRQGDLARGFAAYETRWRRAEFANQRRDLGRPIWRGDRDLNGKTILLHAEQGFGDTLQFVRYVPLVVARGGRVVLEVQPRLRRLIECIPGVSVISRGESLPEFDLHCPLLSLPLALGTTLATIPAQVPYLTADPALVASWRDKLPAGGYKVGIVWSGSREHRNDRDRSMTLHELVPLLATPGVAFVTLNPELSPEDTKLLADFPQVTAIAGQFRDFADTAAVIGSLDLVVSADSSTAHLAGALGREIWILLRYSPDWRWLLNRDDSPWYPTARLWRQPTIGAWQSLITQVADHLAVRLHG